MQLSRAEFESLYKDGTLRVALIGMSNIGKSYTGMRLATDYDMSLIEVDKLIWQELGQGSMDDFAAWQGQPYSDGYAEREAESIALETKATAKALRTDARNPLLDTTGSVIYTGADVLDTLKAQYYVVHIRASRDAVNRLKIQYFKQPKPLIWAGHYRKIDGKTPDQSILECYPDLLASRAKAYSAAADHTLESSFILNPDIGIADIYEALKPAI